MRRGRRIATSGLLRHTWILLAALVVAWGGPPAPPASATRVLFIGNSYVFTNDLPGSLATLAQAGKHPVVVDMAAEPGWTLAQHVAAAATRGKLTAQSWDFVVLQEQSMIPAVAVARTTGMYPAVRQLTQAIRAAHAEPVLLLTWGRRDGLRDYGLPDFRAMQQQLTAGTLAIADELGERVAPAGVAWQAALARYPGLALWQPDGSHPTQAGTYLTACVLYATLYHASPVGLPAPDGLPAELARRLQDLARETVLTEPARWHIP
jgi:hypothetical protein